MSSPPELSTISLDDHYDLIHRESDSLLKLFSPDAATPPASPLIKVCGLTQLDNTQMVVDCGVDAIGLNFYPPSKRFINRQTAKRLRAAIPEGVEAVGVFVNSRSDDVVDIATDVGLTAIQFHGDETADQIVAVQQRCPEISILRAFRLSEANVKETIREVKQLKDAGVSLNAVLVDAFVAGEFGGTGHRLNHNLIQQLPSDWPPLIVAGGLNPDNVAECVSAVNPWGVDVASGVESSPGIKSAEKTRLFVQAVRNNPA